VKASRLRPHPKNWRTHPRIQQDALRGMLAEISYADALLARELPDGSLELVDGHLRAEITPDVEVPVLVLDLDEQEAAKLLGLLDPLAELAEADHDVLAELLGAVESDNESIRSLITQMLAEENLPSDGQPDRDEPAEVEIPEAFQVVIECRDEAEQKDVFERLAAEGLKCRLLTL